MLLCVCLNLMDLIRQDAVQTYSDILAFLAVHNLHEDTHENTLRGGNVGVFLTSAERRSRSDQDVGVRFSEISMFGWRWMDGNICAVT